MTWLADLLHGRRPKAPVHAELMHEYEALPSINSDAGITAMRFVVVDVETTGLDPRCDKLIAIGAIAVEATLIRFESSFSAVIRQDKPSTSANILVHGIDGTTQTTAPHAPEGLAEFVRFAGKAPLVAFHADFDAGMIGRAMAYHLGFRLTNFWLDLARLAPALLPERGSARTLDEWTEAFGIENYRRHDAVADALATAQLLQIALERAHARGMSHLGDLVAECQAQAWLDRH